MSATHVIERSASTASQALSHTTLSTGASITHKPVRGSSTISRPISLRSAEDPVNKDSPNALSARTPSLHSPSAAHPPNADSLPSKSVVDAPIENAMQPFDGILEATAVPSIAGAGGGGMTPAMRRKESWYFIAMWFPLFLAGWNDASAGTMVPRMQEFYNIGYVVVSMIFVSNCIGSLSAALVNMWLTTRLGFGKTICFGVACQAIAYVIQAIRPPFPLMVISYAINGFGEGLQDAQANGLVALLPTNPNTKMSILHGVFGFGAFVSPLVATQFSNMPTRWSFHYLVSLGVALVTFGVLVAVTRFKTQEALLREIGIQPSEEETHERSIIRQVMELKLVHLMAFFVLIYVGAEVTIGGWIVTFVLKKRGAGKGAGYVSSGFFGGLTVGRMGLIWLNRRVGQQRIIYFYTLAAIALELTIWFIPSLYENAVAVAFVGVALGPFYPIVMNVTSVLLPRRVLTAAIGWIASIGQTGSAAFPFALGAMAEKVRRSNPPASVSVAMLGSLLGIWFLIPTIPRHRD
ncbi:MFS general substrate transporter [Clavulina sp. PMI_390]|nr:MFS general substrate transporter [Clavulina sp. PMI_390]